MRIELLIGSLETGGSQVQMALLAEGLARRGHLVTVTTLFPGGAGATRPPGGDFPTIMRSIEERFYRVLDDDVLVLPGHGDDTTIGTEKPHFDEWVARGW